MSFSYLLRVGSVLIRNLAWKIGDANRLYTHMTTPTTSPFTSIIAAFQQCRKYFKMWEHSDVDRKPSGLEITHGGGYEECF